MINRMYIIIFHSLLIGNDSYIKFQEFMNIDNGRVLDISFFQTQGNETITSNGLFYYYGKSYYVYDDYSQRIVYDKESIETINKLEKQIVYDKNIKNSLNILDILGGKTDGMEFEEILIEKDGIRIPFILEEPEISGNIWTNPTTGAPNKIILEFADHFSIKIIINYIYSYSVKKLPVLDTDGYEIIDLRE